MDNPRIFLYNIPRKLSTGKGKNHMSENQNQREDFRRVNAAGRTLGIRIVAAGFALYMLYEIVMGYIQGGPEAPSLTLLILAILLLGGGAAAVLILGYRGWKQDKAAARMTEAEIKQVEALRAEDEADD